MNVINAIRLKGVSPVGSLVVDIDNTLVDSLSMLAERVPGYRPAEQVGYQLSEEQLEWFSKPEFYSMPVFNWEVVYVILNHLREGYRVLFVSRSPSVEVHKAKRDMVSVLLQQFGSLEGAVPVELESNLDDDWQWSVSRAFSGGESDHQVVFLDDAPHRLSVVDAIIRESLQVSDFGSVSSLAPAYAYNEMWHTEDSPEPFCFGIETNLKHRRVLLGDALPGVSQLEPLEFELESFVLND